MLRSKVSAFLTVATIAAGTVAVGTAAPASAAASRCAKHGPIKLTPGATGVAPFDVTIDLSNFTIDPAHGCIAVLDYGDGSPEDQPTDNVKTWTHHYTEARPAEVALAQSWQGGLNVATATVFPQTPAGQTAVGRLNGSDRVQTAVKISQNQWFAPGGNSFVGQADAVVLARSDKFPDALAGAPLAQFKHGPLLLTDPTYLDPAADAEINRILPKGKTVYILGGPAALSTGIDARLAGEGYKIQRLYGTDRFATALQIAKVGLNDPKKVVVATGQNFADALSAGPLAAGPLATRTYPDDILGQPAAVVLTDGPVFADQATSDYVKSKLQADKPGADCTTVTIVGGAAKAAVTPIAAGSCWDDKLVGADRYATSKLVYDRFSNVWNVVVATGEDFPDALAGGAYAANLAVPLLLTDPHSVSPGVAAVAKAAFSQNGVLGITVLGGRAAVSDYVVYQLIQATKTGSLP
jgi:hypothetical protein